ncbi:hypothetical protein GIB67_004896 [Kingdonia uniflora]|uniref:MULE transposase domain-containing protein n=1 Tax=Kingdonia uniflora TaxID=39325 RepID=A0A7J7LNL4_9MAGN|nr:hypothetical protein GIB67_004896 [Kingdonia uniflora]
MTIISDMLCGLDGAVSDYFPEAKHGRCAWHLAQNMQKKFGSKIVKFHFWPIDKAFTSEKYNVLLAKLKIVNNSAVDYIRVNNLETWVSQFIGETYGHITFNMAESFNNWILTAKYYILKISQVNGGTIKDKVDFAFGFFEKQVPINVVFQKDEMIYIIGVTKAMVSFTVARAGQNEYHHRTEMNKKVYKLDNAGQESHLAMTDFDKTEKDITPICEFPHYGIVKENYLLIKDVVFVLRRELLLFASPS